MKTIQMTLEDDLLREVDRVVRNLKTTRSALIRDSVRRYLKALAERQLEEKLQRGVSRPHGDVSRTVDNALSKDQDDAQYAQE